MGFIEVNKDDEFIETLGATVVSNPCLTDDDMNHIDEEVTSSTDVDQFVHNFITAKVMN